jgi:hypothetical protein
LLLSPTDADSDPGSDAELDDEKEAAHDFFDDVQIDEEDEKALQMFQNK